MERLWEEEAVPWISVAVFAAALAVLEWTRWILRSPPSPWVYTALAVVAVAYSLLRFRAIRTRMARLRLGFEGERAVGEVLETLRPRGAFVFHDIPGDGFNVDHVVVAPTGIYAIETKTLSKRRGAWITFHHGAMLADGRPLDRNPIVQARAAAEWVRRTLEASTGKTFPVRPVVVIPGWWIEGRPSAPDVSVLTPTGVVQFIKRRRGRLPEADLYLAADRLSRHVKGAAAP